MSEIQVIEVDGRLYEEDPGQRSKDVRCCRDSDEWYWVC